MSRNSFRALLAFMILALPGFAVSCAKKAQDSAASTRSASAVALTITSVDLGRGLSADQSIADKTDEFGPHDVIYTSISTVGASPNSVLRARWTFEDGHMVDETERAIAPDGPTVTEFHISNPDGFPPGKYKLEVFMDGTFIQNKEFEVKAK